MKEAEGNKRDGVEGGPGLGAGGTGSGPWKQHGLNLNILQIPQNKKSRSDFCSSVSKDATIRM